MSTAVTCPAPLPHQTRDHLGCLILLPLGVLILVQVLVAKVTGGYDMASLADPDAYMRLVRVQALEGGASWFDSREARIGPATGGHVQHWTRPLDLLLWLGARLLAPASGFESALLLTGQLISPVMLGLAILALNWASAPLLARQERFLACLLLLLQPAVLGYGGLGRADHHSILLLLFLIALGLVVRALDSQPCAPLKAARLAGLVAGIALWISTESLLFIAIFMITLGLPWLAGERRLASVSYDFALATASSAGLALLIERGGHNLLAAEPDRISLVHVVLFAMITVFWWSARHVPEAARAERWPVRLLASLGGTLLVAILMMALFPDLRHGILGRVDPVYQELRLSRILEIQPPVRLEWLRSGEIGAFLNRLLFWSGLALIAVPFLITRMIKGDAVERRRWLPVALGLGLTLPLTFHQVRWGIYAESLLVVPYAAAVGQLLQGLTRRTSGIRLVLVRPPAVALSLLWTLGAAGLLPGPAPVETASGACPVRDLAPLLNRLSTQPRTIMAIADIGPELLYRTHHAVLSIPNHRPQPGFAATAETFASRDPTHARALMREHGADWILICGSASEAGFVRAAAHHQAPTLYDQLLGGDLPPWLRPVRVPGRSTSDVRLLEHVPPGAATGSRGSGA